MNEKPAIPIQRLRVESFGCVRDATLDLQPLTVLVGPNDSGKSMLLQALATMALASYAEQGFATLFPTAAAVAASTFNGLGDAFRFETSGVVQGTPFAYETSVRFALGTTSVAEHLRWGDAEITKTPPNPTTFRLGPDRAEGSSSIGPYQFPMYHPLWQGLLPQSPDVKELNEILTSARPALDCLRSIRLHALRPEVLRMQNAMADVGERPSVGITGYGLSYAIADLLLSGRDVLDRVEKALTKAMPHVKRIDIKQRSHAKAPVYELEIVTRSGARVPSSAISDGVLLYLGYLYLVLGPEPAPVLLVEEPETGIHPGLLRQLMTLFRDMTTGAHGGPPTQILLTTHSPLLLNLVEPQEIRVVQRGEDGATTLTPFTATPDIETLLDYQGPGEIWVNEGEAYIVGGKARLSERALEHGCWSS